MASHHDDDAGNPEMNAVFRKLLQDKGEALTEERMNLLAAGKPGEKALYAEKIGGVSLTQMPDDPLGLRISIGRARVLDEEPAYFVFRGNPPEIEKLLEQALIAFRRRTGARGSTPSMEDLCQFHDLGKEYARCSCVTT